MTLFCEKWPYFITSFFPDWLFGTCGSISHSKNILWCVDDTQWYCNWEVKSKCFWYIHTGRSRGPGPPLFLDQTEAQRQTCQLSRFCRESHDFLSFLTVSRQGSSISRVLGKIILKWFKLLNQNKNGKLTRNACAIKWKTNKEEHCSYFFVPSCDFRLCSINLIVFLRVCPPFWKGSRPWERGLIPRRLPCLVSQ